MNFAASLAGFAAGLKIGQAGQPNAFAPTRTVTRLDADSHCGNSVTPSTLAPLVML